MAVIYLLKNNELNHMKLLFTKGPSLLIRLMVAVLLSSIFIFLDSKVAHFKIVKNYLNNAVEPIQMLANTPSEITSYVYNIFCPFYSL